MASSKGFYVDGMTVEQILALGPDILNSLSQRDMSRALRTVSLAANKRLDRLLNNAILRNGQYVEQKSAKYAIATDALNKLYDEAGQSSKAMRFSVGNKNRNQMYAELMRAKDFMSKKTSTISGAVSVRKMREARLFGKTREDVKREAEKEYSKEYKKKTGKKANKKQRQKARTEAYKHFKQTSMDIWARFRRIWEIPQIRQQYDSDEVLEWVTIRTLDGASEEQIVEELLHGGRTRYEAEREQMENEANAFYDENDGIDFYGEDWNL